MHKDTPVRNVLIFLLVFLVSGALCAPFYVEKIMELSPPAQITEGYFKMIWYLEMATESDLFYMVNIVAAAILYGICFGLTKLFSK